MSLRFVCLALIAERPASGYHIARTVRKGELRHFASASQATIYAVLKQLEREGCLVSQRKTTEGRPDSILFHLTPRGRSQLGAEALDEGSESIVPIVVRFNEHLPIGRIRHLVTSRLAVAERKVDELLCEATDKGSDPLADWLAEAHLEYWRSQVAALADLLGLLAEPGPEPEAAQR